MISNIKPPSLRAEKRKYWDTPFCAHLTGGGNQVILNGNQKNY